MKFFVAVIDAKLFEAVDVEDFEAVDVKHADHGAGHAARAHFDGAVHALHDPREQAVVQRLTTVSGSFIDNSISNCNDN